MSAFLFILTITSALVIMAVAFKPSALAGKWYLHSHYNLAKHYQESTCHSVSAEWYNKTVFEAEYSYKLINGEEVINHYIGTLNSPSSQRPLFTIKKWEETGELSDHCKLTSFTFSKSDKTCIVVSDCFFDASCFSKNEIPTEEDLKEISVLCPGFLKTDNSKC